MPADAAILRTSRRGRRRRGTGLAWHDRRRAPTGAHTTHPYRLIDDRELPAYRLGQGSDRHSSPILLYKCVDHLSIKLTHCPVCPPVGLTVRIATRFGATMLEQPWDIIENST